MIEIRITADTATEALKDLTELTRAMSITAPSAPVGAPNKVKKDKPAAQMTAEPEAPKVGVAGVDPTTAAVAAEKVEDAATADTMAPAGNSAALEGAKVETAPVPEKTDPPKKLTLETVRAAGTAAARKYGKEAVKGILGEMGVEGMTQLKDEQFEEFMRKLGELDA